jgi:hypothetical protein
LYGTKCRLSIIWDNPVHKITLGTKLLKDMEQEMVKIRHKFKAAQDRKKRYGERKITHKEFKVGDHMYLKVKPKRGYLMMGTCAKLAPLYYGPFDVLERVGLVAYTISFPPTVRTHNELDVSLLKKYVNESNHVIDWTMIQVEP